MPAVKAARAAYRCIEGFTAIVDGRRKVYPRGAYAFEGDAAIKARPKAWRKLEGEHIEQTTAAPGETRD